MSTLNAVTLIGRLGRDPEVSHVGQSDICRFSVATDDGYQDKSGQRVDRTTWHTVTVGGKTAENCSRFLHKGSLVCVEGRYLSRKYQTKDGRDAVSWYVQAQRVQSLDGSERGAQNRNCHDHQQGGYDDDWRN